MFDTGWLDNPLTRSLIPWLATYAVHSTLLLAAAWALSRPIGRRWPALEETLWKGALLGGVVTASVSFAGLPPALWWPAPDAVTPAMTVGEIALPAAASPQAPATTSWLALAAAAWCAVALTFLVSLGFSWWRLQRRLANRTAIDGGPLPGILDELLREAAYRGRVRLTSSGDITVPVAFGLLRPEICLPARATAELSEAQVAAAIGHELAHLVRRDPAWRLLVRLFEGVFFFQPLHRLAARRLEQLSEDLSDDWTANRTSGVALARCLAEVAGWSIGRSRLFPVPGMAVRGSELERRVRRLLDRATVAGPAPRRRFALLVAAALLATTWMAPSWSAAPGVSAQDEDQAEESAEEEADSDDEKLEAELEAEIRLRYEQQLRQLEAERASAHRLREDALREHEEALRRKVEQLRLQEDEVRKQSELLERQLRERAKELAHELQALERALAMEERARELSERGRQQEEEFSEQARLMEERAKQQEQQALERALEMHEQARALAEEKRKREKEKKKDGKEKRDE